MKSDHVGKQFTPSLVSFAFGGRIAQFIHVRVPAKGRSEPLEDASRNPSWPVAINTLRAINLSRELRTSFGRP